MILTRILKVTRGSSDITLRLEGRYGVKETVEYLTMGPVDVSMFMGIMWEYRTRELIS